MRISVFGLGYVGTVTAACLARTGHQVIGVDVNPEKVESVAKGQSPIVEPGLREMLSAEISRGALSATEHAATAVAETEASLISVGTPGSSTGRPNLDYVFNVCAQIAETVTGLNRSHTVVLRSTVPPGTTAECTRRMAAACGTERLHVAFNPEFLREGSAVSDFFGPPFTVVGAADAAAESAVRDIYSGIDAPFFAVTPETAELTKYVCNAWHATKVVFANEVGRVAAQVNIDAREVMDLVIRDTKLNISPAYLRPGFAYGGSCLPKDVNALVRLAADWGAEVPLLSSLSESNRQHVDLAVNRILKLGARRVAVFGLSFKPDTDDLRNSPAVQLVKRLLGEGCEVQIFDPTVEERRLLGANRSFILENLPHFECLLTDDPLAACRDSDLVVVTQASDTFRQILADPGAEVGRLLDLAGLFGEPPPGVEYHGITW